MFRCTCWRAPLLALLALAVGCMEANPLPSPGTDTGIPGTPGIDTNDGLPGRGDGEVPPPTADDYAYVRSALTYVSSLAADQTEGTVVVVGEPDAVSEKGTLRLVATAVGIDRPITKDASGGFGTAVSGAYEGLELKLLLLDDTDTDDDPTVLQELVLTVRTVTTGFPSFYFDGDMDDQAEGEPAGDGDPSWGGVPNAGAGGERSGFLSVSAPDADGDVHVRSDVLGVTAYARVLVLNQTDGRSHVGAADSNGGLDMVFPAAAGDELLVFAAAPRDPEATTQAIELTVPAQ